MSTLPASMNPTAAPLVRPWRWAQRWQDVLLAHWQVPPESLCAHLPAGVAPDTRNGTAWVSVVAFRLTVRHRGLPAIGPCSNFLEMNLRTYVRFRGDPAVHFFSLHADSRIAVRLARWLTPLPYAVARIAHTAGASGRYDATRPDGSPLFRAAFRPVGARREVAPGSLDEWLVERYRAYVPDRRGRLFRMSVRHPAWRLQDVEGEITAAGLGAEWGLDLGRPPHQCHFSERVDATVLPFEEVD